MKGLIFLSALACTSCAGPKISSSWSSPDLSSDRFQQVVVVAIIQNEDSTLARQMEDHMAGDIRKLGYKTNSFQKTFSPNDFPATIRYDSARQKLMANGIDAVVTISLLEKETQNVFVRARNEIFFDRNSFWHYYQAAATTVDRNKGHYEKTTIYYWESNVYDLNRGSLIYSARSAFFDEHSAGDMAHRYGLKLVEDMDKQLVLSRR
jgi:hypothetical protein